MIYLDYNATTPVDDDVLQKMIPYFSQKFGNSSSGTHPYGWVANKAVEQAQKQIAKALGCEPQQIIFTSGGTESINMAFKSVFETYSPFKGKHIVTSKTEHKAVLEVCKYLEKQHGALVTYLDVDADGIVSLQQLEDSITEETILVSIMHANNETGTIQPIKKISEIVHAKNSLFMSDCTQTIGKLPINVDDLGIDICCISAHKFYGPKGVGALYYRRKQPRVALSPIIHGGAQQRGLRAGTLNVPGIVGMGEAIELANTHLDAHQLKMTKLRDLLEQELHNVAEIKVLSVDAPRLCNTSNIHFKERDARKMIELVNGALAISTGSACTSATLKHSHVLTAMGFKDEKFSSIRFSLGKYTTKEEIEQTVSILKERFINN